MSEKLPSRTNFPERDALRFFREIYFPTIPKVEVKDLTTTSSHILNKKQDAK